MKETPFPGKPENLVFCATAIFLFFLYLFTAPIGPTPEDSSEFILVAHYLGLAHPPGYPLFTLLGKLFSFWPWGSPAQKIASLSALSISLSAWIWGVWCLRVTHVFYLSWAVCLCFGLCFPNWSSAQLVEVYPLHTFLLTLTFYLAYQLSQDKNPSASFLNLSFWTGFVLGLSLSNHYPLVVLSFPALWILLHKKTELVKWGAGILVGLTPYFYLFFAHHFSDFIFSGPILNFQQFFDYILRKEYSANDRSTVFSFLDFFKFGHVSLKILLFSFTPLPFLTFLLFGKKIFHDKTLRKLSVSLSLGVLSSFVFLFLFWQPDFYLLPIELFETFHGFALGCFLLLCALSFCELVAEKHLRKLIYFLFLIPAFLLIVNFKPLNRVSDNFGSDYANLILQPLPKQSLLLAKGDKDAGLLGYAHFLEGTRPDITLVSQVAALLPKKPFDRKLDIPRQKHTVALLNLISHHLDLGHSVFSVGPIEYFSPQKAPFPLPNRQWGLLTEIFEEASTKRLNTPGPLISFLEKYSNPSFQPNFLYYRDKVFSDICHSLLTLGETHPIFENHPRCTFLKAQWIHVNEKNYLKADELFLDALSRIKLAQDSDLAQMGKDFFLNRLKMLETGELPSQITRSVFILNTLNTALPLAIPFRSCKNPLAPRILALSQQSTSFEMPQDFREHFKLCDWFSSF